MAITAATVLLMFLFMALGAVAGGTAFRVYSIATILAVLGFGAWTGMQVSRLEAEGSVPWLGVMERINIYSMLLWVAVFAIAVGRSSADR